MVCKGGQLKLHQFEKIRTESRHRSGIKAEAWKSGPGPWSGSCPATGEDWETESSSGEEQGSESESDEADSEVDDGQGEPSVIADTMGSLEEPITQVAFPPSSPLHTRHCGAQGTDAGHVQTRHHADSACGDYTDKMKQSAVFTILPRFCASDPCCRSRAAPKHQLLSCTSRLRHAAGWITWRTLVTWLPAAAGQCGLGSAVQGAGPGDCGHQMADHRAEAPRRPHLHAGCVRPVPRPCMTSCRACPP